MRDVFYTNINNYRYSIIDVKSNDICLVNVFDSFIPVIMLNTLRCKSSVLFGIHALLDKSFRVSQIPTYLCNLTADD